MECLAGKIMREITDELDGSHARLEVLIDHVPDGRVGSDLQKAIDHLSRAAAFMESAMGAHEHEHPYEYRTVA